MGSSAETMFLLVDYYAETMLLLLRSKARLKSMASARASFFFLHFDFSRQNRDFARQMKISTLHIYFKKTAVIYETNTFCTTK